MVQIERAPPDDRPAILRIFRNVVDAGESYPLAPGCSDAEVESYWFGPGRDIFVARGGTGEVLGSYFLKANQPGLGAHVANAGFIVAPQARGLGLGRRMGQHALDIATAQGYRAMQFNLVVATNTTALRLWKSIGMQEVGRLPGAFAHPRLGDVDALVLYCKLPQEENR